MYTFVSFTIPSKRAKAMGIIVYREAVSHAIAQPFYYLFEEIVI